MRLALLSCLLLCFCVGCSVTPPTATDVKLNSYFGDNMVLQRDMPIAVYGTAKGPGTVDVSLHSYGCQKYQEVFRQAQVDQTGRCARGTAPAECRRAVRAGRQWRGAQAGHV